MGQFFTNILNVENLGIVCAMYGHTHRESYLVLKKKSCVIWKEAKAQSMSFFVCFTL